MRFIPRRRKKSRKLRGYRLHGYGQQRQHRRSGRGGGFGKAGGHKHFWTWYTAHWPDYFGMGRRGFKRPRAVLKVTKAINIGELEKELPKLESLGVVRRSEEGIMEVDLTSAGYDKLLGRGQISTPLVVKVERATRIAIEKLERAGGKVLTQQG